MERILLRDESTARAVDEVCSVDLKPVLRACGIDEMLCADSRSILPYLSRYLRELNVKLAVVESDYIDRDYLDDYTRYYARCFAEHSRTCHRVHFFDSDFSQEELETIISAADGKSLQLIERFESSYVGFVVLRPLPKTVVGRTCLRAYPEKGTARSYKAMRDVRASFFGRQLQLRCMPFQQQDSATAACATCALWSAFQVTTELFGHKTYCPGCITSLAVEHGLDELRSFPNRGLTLPDMIYAIRRIGLDPICVDEWIPENDKAQSEGVADSTEGNDSRSELCNPQEIILGNIYSYLSMGIPVVLACELTYADGAPYGEGGHAVTICGYRTEESVSQEGTWLTSSKITELYVHDDQIGPAARIKVNSGRNTQWETDWADAKGKIYFSACHLLMPLNNKIRVSFSEMYENAMALSECVRTAILALKEDGQVPSDDEFVPLWDVRLQTICDLKREIRNDATIPHERKLALLTRSLPKYVWNVAVQVNGVNHLRFIVDATDGGQGLKAIELIVHSKKLSVAWSLTTQATGGNLGGNPLFAKLVEEADQFL